MPKRPAASRKALTTAEHRWKRPRGDNADETLESCENDAATEGPADHMAAVGEEEGASGGENGDGSDGENSDDVESMSPKTHINFLVKKVAVLEKEAANLKKKSTTQTKTIERQKKRLQRLKARVAPPPRNSSSNLTAGRSKMSRKLAARRSQVSRLKKKVASMIDATCGEDIAKRIKLRVKPNGRYSLDAAKMVQQLVKHGLSFSQVPRIINTVLTGCMA